MSERTPPRIVIRPDDLPPDPDASTRPSAPRGELLAKVALILGIVSVLFAGLAVGPVAIACGLVAALRGRDGGRTQAFAVAGIFTGVAGMIVWAGILWSILGRVERDAERLAAQPTVSSPSGALSRDAIDRAPEPIRRALLANVSVTIERRAAAGWTALGSGSGVVVAIDGGRGFVLTCRHVVRPPGPEPDRIRIAWLASDGEDARVEWQADGPLDLAIVSAAIPSGAGAPLIAPLGRPELIQVGQPVFAIGDPLSYRSSFIGGFVSAVRTIGEKDTLVKVFQAQIPLNSGNSGGGLYTDRGELVGINSWTLPKGMVEGMGFSISLENLRHPATAPPDPVARALAATATEP